MPMHKNGRILPELDRRAFLGAVGMTGVSCVPSAGAFGSQTHDRPPVEIREVRVSDGVTIIADNGARGVFLGSTTQDLDARRSYLPRMRELLVGRNPLDLGLTGEMLWETIYPGRAILYAEGRDPRTGKRIANMPREARHTKTGRVFMAFSTVDIALWDLRGKLLGRPAYRIMGSANRQSVSVYWRPGEADKGSRVVRRHFRVAEDLRTRSPVSGCASRSPYHQPMHSRSALCGFAA